MTYLFIAIFVLIMYGKYGIKKSCHTFNSVTASDCKLYG